MIVRKKFYVLNKKTQKGINVSLPGVVAKWEVNKEKAIEEVAYYVQEALIAMHKEEKIAERKFYLLFALLLPETSRRRKSVYYDGSYGGNTYLLRARFE